MHPPDVVQRLQRARVGCQGVLVALQRRLRLPRRQVDVAAADQRSGVGRLHPEAEVGIARCRRCVALQQVQRGQGDGGLGAGAAVGALKVLQRSRRAGCKGLTWHEWGSVPQHLAGRQHCAGAQGALGVECGLTPLPQQLPHLLHTAPNAP